MGYPSKLSAIATGKCPRCRKGKLFTVGAFRIRHFLKMPTYCPHCGMRFERETGFWWGAMYVNYALLVGIFVFLLIIIYGVLPEAPSIWVQYAIYFGIIGTLYPGMIRLSRVLWLHWFGGVKFDPKAHDSPPVSQEEAERLDQLHGQGSFN